MLNDKNLRYDLELNYQDNEGVPYEDIKDVIMELVIDDAYSELENIQEWLLAKLDILDSLAQAEDDGITYEHLIAEASDTSKTVSKAMLWLEHLEQRG